MPVSSPRSCPVLIERDDELAALASALANARAGGCRLVFIEGDAGWGKSRLVSEFARQRERSGEQVITGVCSDRDRDFPFAPFVDALRQWLAPFGGERALLPSERASLAGLLPELGPAETGLPPEQEKRRRFESVRALLARLAAERPLVLLLEDLHWADSSSLHLIELLPRRLGAAPVLIIGTIRTGEPNGDLARCRSALRRARAVTEIMLSPLSGDGVDRMLEAMLPIPPLPALTTAIRNRAEGNPFFIEEIVATLPERIEPDWLSGTGALPESVEDAIIRQLRGISPDAGDLAALAAVAGRAVSHAVLREASGLQDVELAQRLDPLLELGLLLAERETGQWRYRFRHALMHEALRARLAATTRRELHRRVEKALARIAPHLAGEIGFHAHAAGDWGTALIYTSRAGDAAWRVQAVVEALVHDRRALDAAIALASDREPELHRRCGAALALLGALPEARHEFETALAQARARRQTEVEQATLDDLAAYFSSRDYAAARRYAEASLRLAREMGDAARIGRALNRLGNVLTNQLHFEAGRALHDEALAGFERIGDRWGSADCLDLIGMARYLGGEVIAAREAFARAAAIFAELGDTERLASARTSRGLYLAVIDGACATSDGPAAYRADAAEGLRLARELSWRAGEAYALAALAAAELGDGRLGTARLFGEQALQIAGELDHQQWQIIALLTLGLIDRAGLAPERARARFAAALKIAETAGAEQWRERLQAWLDPAPSNADQSPASIGRRRHLIASSERALAVGAYATALAATELLLRGAAGPRPAEVLRLHAEALAGLGRFEEADTAYLNAGGIAAQVGPREQCWRVAEGRSRLWSARDPAIASAEAARARDELIQLAESERDDVRRRELLEHPDVERLIAPSGRRRTRDNAAPGGLTRREWDVARCVSEGSSNREIARVLSISEKTVEMHVSSCLGKLGFSSRAQLAAWIARAGDTGDAPEKSQGFP